MAKFKKLTDSQRSDVESTVKMLLHAGRDCMRNRKEDTSKYFLDFNNPYYCEAFGIMRGLACLGYGDCMGPSNIPGQWYPKDNPHSNLKWWLDQIEKEVMREENWSLNSVGDCDYCYERYGKCDIRSK